jgi:hypothetical protein
VRFAFATADIYGCTTANPLRAVRKRSRAAMGGRSTAVWGTVFGALADDPRGQTDLGAVDREARR